MFAIEMTKSTHYSEERKKSEDTSLIICADFSIEAGTLEQITEDNFKGIANTTMSTNLLDILDTLVLEHFLVVLHDDLLLGVPFPSFHRIAENQTNIGIVLVNGVGKIAANQKPRQENMVLSKIKTWAFTAINIRRKFGSWHFQPRVFRLLSKKACTMREEPRNRT